MRIRGAISIGDFVRIDALSIGGIELGDHVTIGDHAQLLASGVIRNLGEGINVGDRSSIGMFNIVWGQGGVDIGADCLLGPNVTILSENHNSADLSKPIREQGETRARTTIDDNVWLGAGVTVLAGRTIGTGAIVAAGAVVTRDVAPNAIVAGVPAKAIGHR